MASDWDDVHKTIEERMTSLWNTATAALLWDNVKGEPPSDGTPWIRTTIVEGQSVKIELGGSPGRHRSVGVVMFQIFTAIDKGSRPARAVAKALAILFRSVTVNGIIFKAPSLQRVGDTKDGWYQMNLVCPFRWDVTY
jgi:hypothetical protein